MLLMLRKISNGKTTVMAMEMANEKIATVMAMEMMMVMVMVMAKGSHTAP